MSAAEDAMILLEAKEAARIVATLDADFHRLLALSGESLPSVIRIRLEGLHGNEAASLLEEVLARCGTELAHGALVTVQSGRLRIRRLPLSFPP